MLLLLLLLGIQIRPLATDTPNRQPQLAAQAANVGLAYGAGNVVYFAASADSGTTFGQPVIVSSSGQLALGMHRGPRVAYDAEGPEKPLGAGRNPAAATTRRGAYGAWTEGKAGLLRRPTVAQPEVIAEDGGFPSMAALVDGSVVVAWESKGIIMVRPAE
jgi:hypothetical protein